MAAANSPRLFVISGPSGVGKDAVIGGLKARSLDCHFVVTATTRPIRPGERDGVDYIFTARPDFERMIAENELLEWAEVYGNLYGVPKSQVADALERGQDVILKIDVQGARTVRGMFPEATLIFLAPPSAETLVNRLSKRGTETGEALRVKIDAARAELEEAAWYDHRVINADGMLDAAVSEIEAIVGGMQLVG